MIAVWMLYCLGIGLAFVIVGHALERGLHLAGRATRWAWVIAIVGSYLVPVAAWLRPDAFATFAAPIPVVAESRPSLPTSTTSTNLDQPPPSAFSLADLDRPLRWAWMIASLALILFVGVGARRLIALRRRWRPANVDGRNVLISPSVGPAVVGVWAPSVVLPEWALEVSQHERAMMFAHEEEHMRAGDPALNALGFWLLVLAPWNLALWWQWRRLRLAVEVDCDARVLAAGCSAVAYGDLLLRVAHQRRPGLVGVAAFGEPVSFLESRIRRMVARIPRWRWVGVAAALIVAAGAIVAACEAPRPLVPQALAQEPAGSQIAGPQTAWLRDNVRQFFPTLADSNGPPLDAYLIHDAQRRVYQGTVTQRGRDELRATDLRRVFQAYDRGHDGWGVVDRGALRGIVRDNVRVIWLHHDPQPQDSMPSLEDRLDALRDQHERVIREAIVMVPGEVDSGVRLQLEQTLEQLRLQQLADARHDAIRKLAQQSEPAAFASARDAIAIIVDSENRLVAHASGTYEPGKHSCDEVLARLLPAYRNTRFQISGCMTSENLGRVVIYWGQLANR